jgi:hypothetical protein
LKSLTVDDLLFYKTEDLVSVDSTVKIINEFFVKVGLNSGVKNSTEKYGDEYFVNMMYTLFQPESVWHNNDSKVIWFDFNKLNEMEDWVSNKIGKNFKLERCNTSSYCNPKLVLNDEFIEKYNNIYNFYDLPKTIKTLI